MAQAEILSANQVVIEDLVIKIVDTQDGHKIRFATLAGVYYLKKSIANYPALLSILRTGQAQQQMLKLKVDATSLEIQAAIAE